MRIDPGELDRRIELWRSADVDDGTATVKGEPAKLTARWARKIDVKDGEKASAGENAATLASRFLVLSDSVTRTLNPASDTLRYKGRSYEIVGVKESGERDDGIEITTSSRTDVTA
ncbi:phage head completion protein [Sphingomonas sp. Leaf242]|uniref:phage head completion protein n=1 Tax=Sphingomonas sp. Leaf242 TaxID=1736304 RepID=UPI000A3F6FF9|nr:head-tail adaptor protein [Sphingomonas sp. Leaf242]